MKFTLSFILRTSLRVRARNPQSCVGALGIDFDVKHREKETGIQSIPVSPFPHFPIFPDPSIAMNAFCGRISRGYNDLSGVFMEWKEQCEYLWVYEHEADEKVSRTHCHFLCLNSQRDNKGVKNISSYKVLKLKGNGDHSMKTYDPAYDESHKGEWYEYIKYMSKGVLMPMLVNGANANDIANVSKSKWTTPAQGAGVKSGKSYTDRQLEKVKKTQWDIVVDVRNQLNKMNCIDSNGNIVVHMYNTVLGSNGDTKSVPEHVYDVLIAYLEEYKIKSNEVDIDRWITTILRADPKYSKAIKRRILSKWEV